MKTTYIIQGMTCNGCSNSVAQTLSNLEGVHKVVVSLEKGEAIMDSNQLLDIAILRKLLPSKYAIRLKSDLKSIEETPLIKEDSSIPVSKWRQLTPLFLILGYIAIASVLLHYKTGDGKAMMMDFMGLFFIVFSFFKMLDLKGFTQGFAMYDPLAAKVSLYAWVYPFIEIGLGLMLLLRWQIDIAYVVTIVVLGITTVGVTKSLLRKDHIQCACLGTALKLPMTEATFIENAIMIAMACNMVLMF